MRQEVWANRGLPFQSDWLPRPEHRYCVGLRLDPGKFSMSMAKCPSSHSKSDSRRFLLVSDATFRMMHSEYWRWTRLKPASISALYKDNTPLTRCCRMPT